MEPRRNAIKPANRAPQRMASRKLNLNCTVKMAAVYAPMDMKPALPKENRRVKPVRIDIPKTAMTLMHVMMMTPCR